MQNGMFDAADGQIDGHHLPRHTLMKYFGSVHGIEIAPEIPRAIERGGRRVRCTHRMHLEWHTYFPGTTPTMSPFEIHRWSSSMLFATTNTILSCAYCVTSSCSASHSRTNC